MSIKNNENYKILYYHLLIFKNFSLSEDPFLWGWQGSLIHLSLSALPGSWGKTGQRRRRTGWRSVCSLIPIKFSFCLWVRYQEYPSVLYLRPNCPLSAAARPVVMTDKSCIWSDHSLVILSIVLQNVPRGNFFLQVCPSLMDWLTPSIPWLLETPKALAPSNQLLSVDCIQVDFRYWKKFLIEMFVFWSESFSRYFFSSNLATLRKLSLLSAAHCRSSMSFLSSFEISLLRDLRCLKWDSKFRWTCGQHISLDPSPPHRSHSEKT